MARHAAGVPLQPHLAGAGDLQGAFHGPRFVAGFLVFERGYGVGYDTAASLEVGDAVLEESRAECYAGVEAAVDAVVAGGAGVGTAAGALQLVDDLHGPDLRSSRDGPSRERGGERIEGGQALAQISLDGGDDMHDVRVALYLHEALQLHRADLADAPEVVAA